MESVGMAIYIAFAVVALYGALCGARKGLYKSLIDAGVTVVTALLSVWLAKLISKSLVNVDSLIEGLDTLSVNMPDMAEIANMIKDVILDLSESSNAVGMLMALPVVILTPFIFMILYLVIGAIIRIPKIILTRSIFGKNGGEEYHGGSRIFGGAVGLVVKAVSFAIFIIPLVGYLNIAGDTMLKIGTAQETPIEQVEVVQMADDELDSEEEEDSAQEQAGSTIVNLAQSCNDLHAQFIAPIIDNVAIKSIHICGGRWIFNSLSSARVEDQRVQLKDEVDVIASIFVDITPLLSAPIDQYGEDQTTAVTNLVNTLDRANVVPCVVSGVISYASQAWLDGEEVLGYPKVIVGEYYEPTLDKILTMLSTTTEDTIKQDIHTLGNIVNICISNDMLAEIFGGGNVINVVAKEEFMGEIFVELHKNHLTRPLAQDMLNALKNYIYRIYNDVNGTNVPYPVQIDMERFTELMVYNEGALVASIIGDFMAFYETFDMTESNNTKLLIQTDLRSLGKALDKLETSLLLGDSYDFLLKAVLKSKGANEFKFLTPDFVDLIINTDTSMETILVARQQIAIIMSATDKEDRTVAIEHLLSNVDEDTATLILETLTPNVLEDTGMNDHKSEALSSTVGSLITQIAVNKDEMSAEQIQKEVEAIDTVISTVHSATDEHSAGSNLFTTPDDDDALTEMSASDLVGTLMDSNIVTDAIISASKDEQGNVVEDPYKISDKLTDSDKASAKDAIESYYAQNASPDGSNEELANKLSSLANVFGVDVALGE